MPRIFEHTFRPIDMVAGDSINVEGFNVAIPRLTAFRAGSAHGVRMIVYRNGDVHFTLFDVACVAMATAGTRRPTPISSVNAVKRRMVAYLR
jgi:hypothetical protein